VIADSEQSGSGRLKQIAPTIRLSETPAEMQLAPPRLGQQTREILREAGYSDEEIEAMKKAGAVA
jgi:crotonobetainyl-CoA:carnitine CoA-transferase CaiB-like acyl-CoA transferase